MKKCIKKSIIILVTIVLILYFNVVTVKSNNDSQLIFIQKGVNINLKDSIKRSTYNKLLAGNENLGSNYNLSENYNIIVKNQKQTGSCWAFAYTSMIETTIKDNNEYSPMHIEYSISDIYNKDIGAGGSFLMALVYAASETGPIYEKDFKFDSVYDEEKNSRENYYLTDKSKISLDKYLPEARIEDESFFPQIYKSYNEDGSIKYKSSNSYSLSSNTKTYTENEVKSIRNLIKKHIKEDGGVCASFYTDIGITENGEFISEGGYYDSVNKSFYSEGNGIFFSKSPNHAVTIVGWDDSFSKNDFAEGNKPENDGAYIVLNSYGKEFGDNGYFYVSYDDYAIEQQILGINEIVKIDRSSKVVKHTYQYDELGMNDAIGSNSLDSLYAANVFSRKNATSVETLNEVALYLDKAEGIEIYINPSSDDKKDCKLVATYTGEKALDAGYHILKFPSPIKLTGNKFVVKIKYINKEGPTIPLESNYKSCGIDANEEILKLYENAKSNQGESFISTDGTNWNDIYNFKIGNAIYKDSNVCIKAFTTEQSGEEEIKNTSVTGVILDKTNLSMQVGDKSNLIATIKPENAVNKNVKWTSSDENIVTVSENGIITAKSIGIATITVTTEDGKFSASCKITVSEKKNTDDDIYKDDTSDKKDNKTENTEKTEIKDAQNTDKRDSGEAKSPLPQTGSKSIIGVVIIVLVLFIVIYIKCKKFKDIK